MTKIIAIDFDGTLCEDRWPEIGEPKREVILAAKWEQKHGAALILWTCRCGKLLDDAVRWCSRLGLHFDAVNANTPERLAMYGTESRKVSADEYWEDRSRKPEDISRYYLYNRERLMIKAGVKEREPFR